MSLELLAILASIDHPAATKFPGELGDASAANIQLRLLYEAN